MGHGVLRRTERAEFQIDNLRRRTEQLERRYRFPIGFYEIKCWADRNALDGNLPDTSIVVAAGVGKFLFPIPKDLNNYFLVEAECGISVTGSSDVEVMYVNLGVDPEPLTGTDMLTTPIVIPAGDWVSWTPGTGPDQDSPWIDTANNQVSSGDWMMVDVQADGGTAEGLVSIWQFVPSNTQ